ncbi:ABC transporter ATP-binding protein [Streptomyces sp. WMMB 322]|uniref:ABC transporter ATP-binding protein n=1 Tax=Streptomyces sp. WMMB 322 TaxID=1286821 RepID=UPI0008239A34|nr:ABC transporter ATP-binding protein [Streptomyces sp. WMMB 322]SCK27804.1 phospholipid/cholesterol/gamma-HCH transport system ATP-binding protein [Streptomyces sp. WMMB 322]
MGVEISVSGLTKSFGTQVIWQDVSLTLPAGEISVMLGPSGTGKSVFLKTLVGLLRPDRGSIHVAGQDITQLSRNDLYEVRKLFGVLFQDGALFGSMNLYDNIAFPLREHTRKPESEIKKIVSEKMDLVGLIGDEDKLPGEISGGMRKRAGLARALVLDPEIILFDEPDSGLDPVRVAYLNQLIVDLNAQIDATFLIVTHDIASARQVPDNIGLLFRRELVMFGPRALLLHSDEPVVGQFLGGRMQGPIGMAEEKDAAQVEQELAELKAGNGGGPPPDRGAALAAASVPRLLPSAGIERPRRWETIAELERARAAWVGPGAGKRRKSEEDRVPGTARGTGAGPRAQAALEPARQTATEPAGEPEGEQDRGPRLFSRWRAARKAARDAGRKADGAT